MEILNISLFFSTLLCSLVTGFILTYAIVVMPGLSKLDDKEFIKAFQVTDGIIQNNQPIFILISRININVLIMRNNWDPKWIK